MRYLFVLLIFVFALPLSAQTFAGIKFTSFGRTYHLNQNYFRGTGKAIVRVKLRQLTPQAEDPMSYVWCTPKGVYKFELVDEGFWFIRIKNGVIVEGWQVDSYKMTLFYEEDNGKAQTQPR